MARTTIHYKTQRIRNRRTLHKKKSAEQTGLDPYLPGVPQAYPYKLGYCIYCPYFCHDL